MKRQEILEVEKGLAVQVLELIVSEVQAREVREETVHVRVHGPKVARTTGERSQLLSQQ